MFQYLLANLLRMYRFTDTQSDKKVAESNKTVGYTKNGSDLKDKKCKNATV